MRSMVVLALLIASWVAAGWGAPPALAQGESAEAGAHAIVGSWLVEVEVEGQPPLRLPNLTSFTNDGVVMVSAPTLLPEVPGAAAPRDVFSTGHGAWAATDDETADVRFVFLVVDERGTPASINIVDGQLEVEGDGSRYTGEFTLTILSAAGETPSTASGTWDASRIVAGSELMEAPMALDGNATPAASEPVATPAA